MDSAEYEKIVANVSEDFIYACDIKTYDVYYMNEVAKKISGYTDKGYKGEKCYKVFLGYDEPCSFCPMNKLKENEPYEWDIIMNTLDVITSYMIFA